MSESLPTSEPPGCPTNIAFLYQESNDQELENQSKTFAQTVVLKFGSSVLTNRQDYHLICHEIYLWYRRGYRVVAVVSAMGSTTDDLLSEAESSHHSPAPEMLANLLATGEWTSAARLGLALDRIGIPARVLDPATMGLETSGPTLNARCTQLDIEKLQALLLRHPVVVAPGFVGRDNTGATTLLGRGGTDLSALFFAERLGAEKCQLLKDVDGLFDRDPALFPNAARQFDWVSYRDVLDLEEGIVQHKAVQFAREKNLTFEVCALLGKGGTTIADAPSRYLEKVSDRHPCKIALWGSGSSLEEVLRAVKTLPHLFQIVSVNGQPADEAHAESTQWQALISKAFSQATLPDVVVDLGLPSQQAYSLAIAALDAGVHMVSANTAFVAGFGPDLSAQFQKADLLFQCHAAVAAGLPVLETLLCLAGCGQVRSLTAALSWQAQSILNRLVDGETMVQAEINSLASGVAATDLERAVTGEDCLDQLLICLNIGFGLRLERSQIDVTKLDQMDAGWISQGRDPETYLGFVAEVDLAPNGIQARILPKLMNYRHPLANLAEDGLAMCLNLREGPPLCLYGRERGNLGVVQAIVADLITAGRQLRETAVPRA